MLRSRWGGIVAGLALAALGLTGCAKQAPKGPAQTAAQPQAPADPPNTTRHKDLAHLFSIALPNDWKTAEHYKGTAVAAFGPAQAGRARPTLNVVVENLSSDVPLEAYFQMSQQKLGQYIAQYKALESGDTTIDGKPAKWLLSSYRDGAQAEEAIAWFVLAGKRAYIITGAADPADFATLRPQLEALAISLRIETAPAKPALPGDIKPVSPAPDATAVPSAGGAAPGQQPLGTGEGPPGSNPQGNQPAQGQPAPPPAK